MNAHEVGQQLVALCREGKNLEAVDALYAEDVVSIEAIEPPGPQFARETRGRDAVRAKNAWWLDSHEVHGGEVRGPFPHGERFAVLFQHEVTPTAGPMAGQRMHMEEVGLYTVEGGKITREEFFYAMG